MCVCVCVLVCIVFSSARFSLCVFVCVCVCVHACVCNVKCVCNVTSKCFCAVLHLRIRTVTTNQHDIPVTPKTSLGVYDFSHVSKIAIVMNHLSSRCATMFVQKREKRERESKRIR